MNIKNLNLNDQDQVLKLVELFKTFDKKSDIFEYFNINNNSWNSKLINNIAEKIGFDFSYYRDKKYPKKYCLYCGKELNKTQNKFCSNSCSATYNNVLRGVHSEETKNKIRESIKKYYQCNTDKPLHFRTCPICKEKFQIFLDENGKLSNKKYCSIECENKASDRLIYINKNGNKDTKKIGDISEMKVAIFATEHNIEVSKPIGDRCRYDQIWDINGKLLRIQVKSPYISNGTLEVNCKSISRINGKSISHSYNEKEIDAIVVPYNNNCYILLPGDFGKGSKLLRFEKPLNENRTNINWLEDYSFDKRINDLINK